MKSDNKGSDAADHPKSLRPVTPDDPIPEVKLDFFRVLPDDATLKKISHMTNIDYKTIWSHHKIMENPSPSARYTLDVLESFCDTMDCHVADILYLDDDPYIGMSPREHREILGRVHPIPKLPDDYQQVRYSLTIQSNLAEILAQREISVRELSEAVNKSYESIRRLSINKARRIPKATLEAVCYALDIRISSLFSMVYVPVDTSSESTVEPFIIKESQQISYVFHSPLKAILEDRGLSIEKVAKETGIPYSFLYQLYSNKVSSFNAKHLAVLASYLDLHPYDIVIVEKGY